MNQPKIPPSLLAEATRCERRGWLSAQGMVVVTDPRQTPAKKPHLPKQQGDWLYEVRLPSGARLDGWHGAERVAVEYKTGEPHVAHVMQGWAYAEELKEMGIRHAEIQLWYPAKLQKKAAALAEKMGLKHRVGKENDMMIIWLNAPEIDFAETVQAAAERIKNIAAKDVPPEPKPRTSPACQVCPYHDFCHL